jgi:hypothetical protein
VESRPKHAGRLLALAAESLTQKQNVPSKCGNGYDGQHDVRALHGHVSHLAGVDPDGLPANLKYTVLSTKPSFVNASWVGLPA